MSPDDGVKYPALHIDPGFKRYLIRYFSIGAVFYVLAATIQTTFYHPDQHFQTLEGPTSRRVPLTLPYIAPARSVPAGNT